PEPDLPPLSINREWVAQVQARLPELPDARRERFQAQYGLSRYDATLLTVSKAMADFLEACLKLKPVEGETLHRRAKAVSNWMLGDFLRLLNLSGLEPEGSRVTPAGLMGLIDLVEAGTVSSTQGKVVLEEMFNTGKGAGSIVEEKGLVQISDANAVRPAVEQAIAANPQALSDYLRGKETAIRFLVGQVMKLTRGKANPALVNELLKQRLEALRQP
ncbi:MAG: Asp-tRNA(Asn)/Glu-tRNA(Gln) amidotransferase GatCAB subunit B, partial [Chloroflexi bacterium]|nr:Asp-tRNA(Asn)/Glu-tRNA(Gln) amidotransferase GatCAB subunit B [Chloroflexota bacterium]